MAKPRPSISVVVPVFNGARTLENLVDRISATMVELTDPYEIVLVSDGSTDGSWDKIQGLGRRYPSVRGVELMRNYGQHNAILAGVRHSKNEVIVTLDDDLENPPEEIPKLLEALEMGFDVIYGWSPRMQRHGTFRAMATWLTKWALRTALGVKTARSVSAFRAFRRNVAAAFDEFAGPYVSIDVLLGWSTTRFGSVRVEVSNVPSSGKSRYNLPKLMTHTLNLLIGFSTWPLRLVSIVGFTFTLFGLGVLAYVLARYAIEGSSVPGFAFLASATAIFAGAQLFSLGLIGEYLARMHFRLMERPPYSIRGLTEEKKDRQQPV